MGNSADIPFYASHANLGDELGFALYSASLTMTKTYRAILEPLDLTYPQYLAMLVLWDNDDVLVKEIAAHLSLDSATVTPILKRLESQGYITRIRDTFDERRVFVRLTKTGQELKLTASDVTSKVFQATRFSMDLVLQLTENLRSLRETLQNPKT